MLWPYFIRKKRLRIYFPTTKYSYGIPHHLFHLICTIFLSFFIFFAIFHHGSQYLATLLLSSPTIIENVESPIIAYIAIHNFNFKGHYLNKTYHRNKVKEKILAHRDLVTARCYRQSQKLNKHRKIS